MQKTALALLVLMLFTGCKFLVKEPVVTVQELSVQSVDGGGAGMQLRLKVKNTNAFDLRLLGYRYRLQVLELPLAQGEARVEATFPAGGEGEFSIPVRVSYRDLLEIFKRKTDPEQVPFQLIAGLDLDTPLGKMSLPVQKSGSYAIPKQFRPGPMLDRVLDFLKLNR